MITRPIRIAIGHISHTTIGRHSYFMPVNIAYIAAYTRRVLGNDRVDIRLYTEADSMLDEIDEWHPDIVAVSNYIWTSEIGRLILRHAKRVLPGVVCISGGPDVPTEQDEREVFLRERPEIDFYVYLEGEAAFALLVEKLAAGQPVAQLKAEPQLGIMAIDPTSDAFVIGPEAPRIIDMDIIPSPYLTGMMDQWFNGQWAPSIEMARGCPYTCGFCMQGHSYFSKVARFSAERIIAELSYMAERMAGYPDVLLSICDSNFGMYRQDEEIAEHISQLQDTYNWPNYFEVTTGKSHYDRILGIAKKLKNKMIVSASVQSLNKSTLEVIRRRNLPLDKYIEIQEEIRRRGMGSSAEIIAPLPNETLQSYFDGVKTIADAGVETIIPYTTMMLKGTWLASRQVREDHQIESRYRILPRQFGEYRGQRCFEIEEVAIATKDMCYDDYLKSRGFALLSQVLTYSQFDIIHALLKLARVSKYDYLKAAWDILLKQDGGLKSVYDGYLQETSAELFLSPESVRKFYSLDENYGKLLRGEIGDNLMRRYRAIILAKFSVESMNFAFDVLELMLGGESEALTAARKWSLSIRRLDHLYHLETVAESTEEILSHDVMAWYSVEGQALPLEEFPGVSHYRYYLDRVALMAACEDERRVHDVDQENLIPQLIKSRGLQPFYRRCERL